MIIKCLIEIDVQREYTSHLHKTIIDHVDARLKNGRASIKIKKVDLLQKDDVQCRRYDHFSSRRWIDAAYVELIISIMDYPDSASFTAYRIQTALEDFFKGKLDEFNRLVYFKTLVSESCSEKYFENNGFQEQKTDDKFLPKDDSVNDNGIVMKLNKHRKLFILE